MAYCYQPDSPPTDYRQDTLGADYQDAPDPNALFTRSQQKWDEDNYSSIRRPGRFGHRVLTPLGPPRLIFHVYDRAHQGVGESSDDHTWIELRSQVLINLLQSEPSLKGVVGLYEDSPGLDARHIFLKLDKLKGRAAILEKGQAPEKKTTIPESNISLKASLAAPTPTDFESTGKLGPSVVKVTRPTSAGWLLPFASVLSNLRTSKLKQSIPEPAVVKPTFIETQSVESLPMFRSSFLPPLPISGQLSELLRFVEEDFAETHEDIKRMLEDGYVPYKLLWAMCTPDTVIQGQDEVTGKPIGIRVESWTYGNRGETFSLHGTMYEWNGKMFSTKEMRVEIPRFNGLIKVDQLPVRVLSEETRAALVARGKVYTKYLGVHHLQYKSILYGLNKHTGSRFKVQAHGKVMVDPVGYNQFGGEPHTFTRGYIGSSQPRKTSPEQLDANFNLSDDILCLMPPTQVGYSFSAGFWGRLNVEDLSDLTFDGQLFDRLLIPDEYKEVIKAQAETYALKGDQLVPDLRGNKLSSTVMVLHGNPGTGKTLTAEAVAEHVKLPLYKVHIRELFGNQYSIDLQLRDIATMAASWNAIVLVDDADLYLETPEGPTLTKSSLAGAFLRMLDYYTGVLILKSDVIQKFDKAFASRLTTVLHYPDLDQDSRFQIWREFLGLAHVEVGTPEQLLSPGPGSISHGDAMKLASQPMNGHAIEQHIRDAQAIAIAKNEPLGFEIIERVIGVKEKMKLNQESVGMGEEL